MRGLDTDEVYAFLSTVADEYETVLSDNKRLREHIVELEERLKEYRNIEENLRNTLLTAEKVTAEAKENARREAGLIVREAEMEAEKAAEAIRAHTQQLRREVLELKKQKDNYLTRLKTLLDSHRKVLEGFEEDFASTDIEIERIGQQVEEDVRKSVQKPRMSRERITEEYSHETKDKATWGEERRREDEPRPSWDGGKEPGRTDSPMEDSAESSQMTFPIGGEKSYDAGQVETEPLGAFDETGPTPSRNVPSPESPPESGTAPHGTTVEEKQQGDNQVRRKVARRIEEKLYPDVDIGEGETAGDSAATQEIPRTVEPGAPRTETAEKTRMEAPRPEPQTDTLPETEAPLPHDEWRQYKVREEKPDWREYEIAPEKKPPVTRAKEPSDNEVEEALSGLKEFGSGKMDRGRGQGASKTGGPEEAEGEKDESPVPETSTESEKHIRTPKPDDGAPRVKPEPEKSTEQKGKDKDSESPWSMEQLRRNLSNFGGDEDN